MESIALKQSSYTSAGLLATLVLGAVLVLGLSSEVQSAPPAPADLIVLGQVLDAQAVADGPNANYTYRVRVICEAHGRVRPDAEITVRGRRMLVRSFVIRIPAMARGTYFLMPVRPTQNSEEFTYELPEFQDCWLAIGLRLPTPIAQNEISDLTEALTKYGELPRKNGGNLGLTQQQIDDLRSSKNYFLWALGTTAIAEQASDAGDAHLFINDLELGVAASVKLSHELDSANGIISNRPTISPRQALWLMHCLRDVVPEKVRPSCDETQGALLHYLDRLINSAEATTYAQ
jgi:hypothetical protein